MCVSEGICLLKALGVPVHICACIRVHVLCAHLCLGLFAGLLCPHEDPVALWSDALSLCSYVRLGPCQSISASVLPVSLCVAVSCESRTVTVWGIQPLSPFPAALSSPCVPEDLFSCFFQLLFLLDLTFPPFSQRPSPPSRSLLPAALALLGWPGPQHPLQAATPGLRPRCPPPRQPSQSRHLQQGPPALSSSSCNR